MKYTLVLPCLTRPSALSRFTLRRLLKLSTVAWVTSLLICSTSGYAEDIEFTQAKVRFQSYKQQLTRLQSAPQARYLGGELSSLNQWITQAERELSDDEEEKFRLLVDLVQVQMQLIDVSIEEIIARERIEAVQIEAANLEARAKKEREAIVSLERELGGAPTAPTQNARPAAPAPAPAPQVAQPAPALAPTPQPPPASPQVQPSPQPAR